MDDSSPTDGLLLSPAGGEQPIPDWAPFAVPSDDVWRELQRRRNIIRILQELTNLARDEGYSITASLLAETAARAQATLIRSHADREEHQAELQASALQSLEELAAPPRPAPRRRVQIKPFQLRVPAAE
jgi:hypothetical protein